MHQQSTSCESTSCKGTTQNRETLADLSEASYHNTEIEIEFACVLGSKDRLSQFMAEERGIHLVVYHQVGSVKDVPQV